MAMEQLAANVEKAYIVDPSMKERHKRLTEEMMKKLKSLDDIQKLADSGDPWAAYTIGSAYSSRMAANKKQVDCPLYMPFKDLEKSVTETDEIAMKWFQIAAKGGLPDGMISLAHKIYGNHGLKTDCTAPVKYIFQILL